MGIWHQQLARKQWYPATGRPTGLWLWCQVHTGTGLQQQVLGHRQWYLVCGWLQQQQPGCRLARPHRSVDTVYRLSGSCRIGLWQWQQVQGHIQARLHRPSTQATHSKPSTSNSQQNYLVPRPCSVGQVPGMADSYSVQRPHSIGQVPGMAVTVGYHLNCAMTVLDEFLPWKLSQESKLIISFDHGQQL